MNQLSYKKLTAIYVMLLCIIFFLVFIMRFEFYPEGEPRMNFMLKIVIYTFLVGTFYLSIAKWFHLGRWKKVALLITEVVLLFGLVFFPWIDYIVGLTPEIRLYLSASVPIFFSIALVGFTLKSRRNKTGDSTEWRGIEEVIKNIGPEKNSIALIADIVGLLVITRSIPTCLLPLLWFTFTFATIAIVLMLVNWYVTELVFQHEIVDLDSEEVYLVANQQHRVVFLGFPEHGVHASNVGPLGCCCYSSYIWHVVAFARVANMI